ncbi:hypothetical protein K523DRAFT_363036 [Schizophyllum commune Tattone D]|nr:hypothetical protein K523DRAFT_363036 [Schizophyllum commune Tattone D]
MGNFRPTFRHPEISFDRPLGRLILLTIHRSKTSLAGRSRNLDEGDLVARSLRNEATQEGSHDDRPLVLDGVKSSDFEHLLWFFYESAYRWSGIVDPALTERWESILLLSEKFGMKQAAKVACYALGRAGVLSDVHKIALCVKHGLGKDWVVDELKRTVSRDEPLTQEEGRDLGSDTTILLAAAREALRPQRKDSGVCKNKTSIIQQPLAPKEYTLVVLVVAGAHPYVPRETGPQKIAPRRIARQLLVLWCYLSPKVMASQLPPRLVVLSSLTCSAMEISSCRSYKADPELASRWEDVLVVADMFNMEEVCRVATYALDHNGGLPDIRKISLCVRHEVDKSWAFEAIKRVCARQEALTEEEACDMGLKMAINIASAREIAYKSSGGSTTDSSHRPTRHGTYYIDEGDLVVRRATNYFDAKIQALSDVPANEGGSDDNPLVLDEVKSQDFEHLMWFFYESAYKWSGVVDPALTANWESILLLAEKFDMKQIAKVACYALGRSGVLGDVRKISLCVNHGLGKDWIIEELKRVVARDACLTIDEGRELGNDMTTLLAGSREAFRFINPDAFTTSCINLAFSYCSPCYGSRSMMCYHGIHQRNCGHGQATICPRWENIANNVRDERPDKAVEEMVLPGPQNDSTSPIASRSVSSISSIEAGLFVKAGTSVFSVHAYLLEKASQAFRDMLELPCEGIASTEGKSREHPIILDIEARAFENFLWFLYDSAYEWSYKADPESASKWEDVLVVADMFNMEEVCRVATYALDHHGGLSDIRKISLCVRHDVDKTWAVEAIERVCSRQNALTKEEARKVGLDMTASIASVREAAFKASYGGGITVGSAKIKELVHKEIL